MKSRFRLSAAAAVVSVTTWRDRPLLSGADLSDFVALRRVCGRPDSHVDLIGRDFYDGERLLLPHVGDGCRHERGADARTATGPGVSRNV